MIEKSLNRSPKIKEEGKADIDSLPLIIEELLYENPKTIDEIVNYSEVMFSQSIKCGLAEQNYLDQFLTSHLDNFYLSIYKTLDPNSFNYDSIIENQTIEQLDRISRIENHRIFKRFHRKNSNMLSPQILIELLPYIFNHQELMIKYIDIINYSCERLSEVDAKIFKTKFLCLKQKYLSLCLFHFEDILSKDEKRIESIIISSIDSLIQDFHREKNSIFEELKPEELKNPEKFIENSHKIKKFLLKNYKSEKAVNFTFETCGAVCFIQDLISFQKCFKLDLFCKIFCFMRKNVAKNDIHELDLHITKKYSRKICICALDSSTAEQGRFFTYFLDSCDFLLEPNKDFNAIGFLFENFDDNLILKIIRRVKLLGKEFHEIRDHKSLERSLYENLIDLISRLLKKFSIENSLVLTLMVTTHRDIKPELLPFFHSVQKELQEILCEDNTCNWHSSSSLQDIFKAFTDIITRNRFNPFAELKIGKVIRRCFSDLKFFFENPEQAFKKNFVYASYKAEFVYLNQLEWESGSVRHVFDEFVSTFNELNSSKMIQNVLKDPCAIEKLSEYSPDFVINLLGFYLYFTTTFSFPLDDLLDISTCVFDNLKNTDKLNLMKWGIVLRELTIVKLETISSYEEYLKFMKKMIIFCWDVGYFDTNQAWMNPNKGKYSTKKNPEILIPAQTYLSELINNAEERVNTAWNEFLSLKIEPNSKLMVTWKKKCRNLSILVNKSCFHIYTEALKVKPDFANSLDEIISKSQKLFCHPILLFTWKKLDTPIYKRIYDNTNQFFEIYEKYNHPILSEMLDEKEYFVNNREIIIANLNESSFFELKFLALARFSQQEYHLFWILYIISQMKPASSHVLQFQTFFEKALNMTIKFTTIMSQGINLDTDENAFQMLVNIIESITKITRFNGLKYSKEFLDPNSEKPAVKALNLLVEIKNRKHFYMVDFLSEISSLYPLLNGKILGKVNSEVILEIKKTNDTYEENASALISCCKYNKDVQPVLQNLLKDITAEDQYVKLEKSMHEESMFDHNYLYAMNTFDPSRLNIEKSLQIISMDLYLAYLDILHYFDEKSWAEFEKVEYVSRYKESYYEGTLISRIKNVNFLFEIFNGITDRIINNSLADPLMVEKIILNNLSIVSKISSKIIDSLSNDPQKLQNMFATEEYPVIQKFFDFDISIKNAIFDVNCFKEISPEGKKEFYQKILENFELLDRIYLAMDFSSSIFKNFWQSMTLLLKHSALSSQELLKSDIYQRLLSRIFECEKPIVSTACEFYLTVLSDSLPRELFIQSYMIPKCCDGDKFEVTKKLLQDNQNLADIDPTVLASIFKRIYDKEEKAFHVETYLEHINSDSLSFLHSLIDEIVRRILSQDLSDPKHALSPLMILRCVCKHLEHLLHYIAFLPIDIEKYDGKFANKNLFKNKPDRKISFLEFLIKEGLKRDPISCSEFIVEITDEIQFKSSDLGDLSIASAKLCHAYILEYLEEFSYELSQGFFGEIVTISFMLIIEIEVTAVLSEQAKAIFRQVLDKVYIWITSQQTSKLQESELFAKGISSHVARYHYFIDYNERYITPDEKLSNPLEIFDLMKKKVDENTLEQKIVSCNLGYHIEPLEIKVNTDNITRFAEKKKPESYSNNFKRPYHLNFSVEVFKIFYDLKFEDYLIGFTLNDSEQQLVKVLKSSLVNNEQTTLSIPSLGYVDNLKLKLDNFVMVCRAEIDKKQDDDKPKTEVLIEETTEKEIKKPEANELDPSSPILHPSNLIEQPEQIQDQNIPSLIGNPLGDQNQKQEEITLIKKEEIESSYKFFVDLSFTVKSKFQKKVKSSQKFIKLLREELNTQNLYLNSNNTGIVSKDCIINKVFKSDFEKNAFMMHLGRQNLVRIDSDLEELAKEIHIEYKRIINNFEEYQKFIVQIQSSKKKPLQNQKNKVTDEIHEIKSDSKEDEQSNTANTSKLPKKFNEIEPSVEADELEEEQEDNDALSNVSGLSDFEEFEVDYDPKMLPKAIPKSYFSEDEIDFVKKWYTNTPNITTKLPNILEMSKIESKMSLFSKTELKMLNYMGMMFNEYKNDIWRTSMMLLMGEIFSEPFERLLFLDLILFISHTPKLFDDPLAFEELNIVIKTSIQLNQAKSHEIFVRNTIAFIVETSLCYCNISASYMTMQGLAEIKALKEQYNYVELASRHFDVRGLASSLILYHDLFNDEILLEKFYQIISEFIDINQRDPTYPNYSMNLEGALKPAIGIMIAQYPDYNKKIYDFVFGTLEKKFTKFFDLFENLIPFYQNQILELVERSYDRIWNSVQQIRSGSSESMKLLNGNVFMILEILKFANRNACHALFKPEYDETNLSCISKDFKINISQKLSGLITTLNSNSVKSFMLSLFELLDLNQRNNKKLIDNHTKNSLVSLGLNYFSLISLKDDLNIQGEDNLAEELPLPGLAKYISKENVDSEILDLKTFKLTKTFSTIQREPEKDLTQVIMNFCIKYGSEIMKIAFPIKKEIKIEYWHLVKKHSWSFNLESKRQIVTCLLFKFGECDTECFEVSRDHIIKDFKKFLKEDNMKGDLRKTFDVNFKGEKGIDGGGLSREFYSLSTKQLFDPDRGLFQLTKTGGSLDISPNSVLISNYLEYFELAGITIAKAFANEITIDLSLSRNILKHLLGKNLTLSDLEDIDPELTKNLKWVLENDCSDLGLNFTYESQVLGQRITKELIPNGFEVELTNENKKEYVRKMCEMILQKENELQLKYFLQGFWTIIPQDWISYFTVNEFELMIAGPFKIDLQEMKNNTKYKGYSKDDELIVWLWEILEGLSEELLCEFLIFLTGSSKVSIGGFEKDPPKITYVHSSDENLPIAHTCYHQLDLPRYQSKAKLEEKLMLAIYEGKRGFEIS